MVTARKFFLIGMIFGLISAMLNVIMVTNTGRINEMPGGITTLGWGMVIFSSLSGLFILLWLLKGGLRQVKQLGKPRSRKTKIMREIYCMDCDIIGGLAQVCENCPENPLKNPQKKSLNYKTDMH